MTQYTSEGINNTLNVQFNRAAQVRFEAERYGINLVSHTPRSPDGVPEKFVADIEVMKDQSIRASYFYVTQDDEIDHVLAWMDTVPVLGLDLETAGLNAFDDKIATVQLGYALGPTPTAYTIDIRCVTKESMQPIYDRLRNKQIPKLGQNIRFECKFLQAQEKVKVRNVCDTQLNEMVLRTGLLNPKSAKAQRGEGRGAYKHTSMDALTKRYLGVVIEKDTELRTSFYSTPPGMHGLRQIVYANSDVIYPFFIAKEQKVELVARKLVGIAKVEYKLIPVLADAELTGFRIDQRAWRKLWQEAVKGRAETERKLDELIRPLTLQDDLFDVDQTQKKARPVYPKNNRELNYSSAEQVKWAIKEFCAQPRWEGRPWPREVIINPLHLTRVKKEWGKEWLMNALERGRDVTDKDIPDWVVPEDRYTILVQSDKVTLTLAAARGQLPWDIVDPLLEYSKHDIRCDTFGNEFLLKHVRRDTGCIHTEFHQCITQTGRISTSPNLQNIPNSADYRKCFIPPEGYVFVIADYSTVEPRISAQLSKDENYVLTFKDDDDLYCRVAERMTGEYPDKKTPEGALMRSIFKTVVLALAYSMHARKLRDRLTLALIKEIRSGKVPPPTYDYALDLYNKFFEAHKAIGDYQKECANLADPKKSKRKIWDRFLGTEVTYVTAPCGRKRFFPPDALSVTTEAPNVGPQSGSASITKSAAGRVQDLIDDQAIPAHCVNLVHDEIVWICRKDHAVQFAHTIKHEMEQAGQVWCPDIPIKAEWPENSNGCVPYWAKKLEKGEAEELLAA